MNIEQRVAELEKRHRRLPTTALAVALLAAAVLVSGARRGVEDVVQTRQLEIVNADGQVVAILGVRDGQGQLSLRDAAGAWKVQLDALPGGGTITLKNAADRALVTAGYDDEGNGAVRTSTSLGTPLVALSSTAGARGAVTTFGQGGSELVTLSTTPSGAGAVTTFDVDGRRLIGITVTTKGKGALAAFETDGGVRASWP